MRKNAGAGRKMAVKEVPNRPNANFFRVVKQNTGREACFGTERATIMCVARRGSGRNGRAKFFDIFGRHGEVTGLGSTLSPFSPSETARGMATSRFLRTTPVHSHFSPVSFSFHIEDTARCRDWVQLGMAGSTPAPASLRETGGRSAGCGLFVPGDRGQKSATSSPPLFLVRGFILFPRGDCTGFNTSAKCPLPSSDGREKPALLHFSRNSLSVPR